MPRYLDQIDGILSKCQLLIVVGTSSTVYPAAGFADRVQSRGGKVAVFNLDRSSGMSFLVSEGSLLTSLNRRRKGGFLVSRAMRGHFAGCFVSLKRSFCNPIRLVTSFSCVSVGFAVEAACRTPNNSVTCEMLCGAASSCCSARTKRLQMSSNYSKEEIEQKFGWKVTKTVSFEVCADFQFKTSFKSTSGSSRLRIS
jgi:hypothetical protein